MNEAGSQTQTAKPKKKFGIIRIKAKKSKKTDGSSSGDSAYSSNSAISLPQGANESKESSTAQLTEPSEKIDLNVPGESAKFKLQEDVLCDQEVHVIDTPESPDVVQATFTEDISETVVNVTDVSDPSSKECKVDKEEQPNMMEEPVNSQEQTTALDPNKTQSPEFELQLSGILIEANKDMDASYFEKPNVRPNKNVAPTFKDNASFNQQDDSRVLSPKSGRILNVNAIITEEEKEDGAMSAEISSIEDITREKKETDAGALKGKEVEESISFTVKEEYFSQLDGSHDGEKQNESSMNKEIESLEHPEEHQVEEQIELQQDDSVEDDNVGDEDDSEKTVSIESITVEDNPVSLPEKSGQAAVLGSLHNLKGAFEDSKVNDLGEPGDGISEPILSTYKDGEVATQDDSQEKEVQEKSPERNEEKVVHPNNLQVYGRHESHDHLSNKDQPVLRETGENEEVKPEKPLKPSSDYEERSQQKDVLVTKKRKSALSLFWCCFA